MTLSAASVPHPLADESLVGKDWQRWAVTELIGSRWPAGDEAATWDVADQWYALADALSGPRLTAFAAAERIMAGLAAAGTAPDGFRESWERLSAGDDAPLNALVQIAAELGQLVEECGREIETAKLAASIEVGTLLIELAALPIAVELTLGAATPIAEGLIAASRVAIERIFERLDLRLGAGPAVGRPTVHLPRKAASHRRAIDHLRYDEYADFLASVAAEIRASLAAGPPGADADGDRALRAYAEELELQAALERARPRARPSERAPEWARRDRERPTAVHFPGELRAVHPVPLRELAEAVPAAGDGRPDRLADPRVGGWFALLNAGGPSADPTRGLNCLDAVLALFETYQRGQPRVAAARVFDGYAHGEPERPMGGEWAGVRRVQQTIRGEFQNLCPYVGGAPPNVAQAAVDAALRNLSNHLHNSGHGAFAVILTELESGGCHAWAAINHGGAILFLDPQLARIAVEQPLYGYRGDPDANVVSLDALVVDGHGDYTPLPHHGAGQWTAQALEEGP